MAELLWPMTYWHWLAFGLLLFAAEALIPGFVLMWFGAGAIITGLALWLMPDMSWQWQMIVLAVVSVSSLLLWRIRLKNHPTQSEQPGLNERGSKFIGREFVSPGGIQNGVGRVVIGDTSWRVQGRDCDAGSRVKVIATDGATLIVEQA